MRLYEIPAYLRLAADYVHIDEETGEIRGAEEFENLRIEAHEKCLSVAKYLKEMRYEMDAIRNEERQLAQRRHSIENRFEYFKARLNETMKALEESKLSDAQVAISFRQNPASAVIHCPFDALPDRFKKVTIEPNKLAIRDALNAGESIEGCELRTTTSLVIK